MILSEFLKAYRNGIKAATNKHFSVLDLALLLGVSQDRLTKWEGSKTVKPVFPTEESDRKKLREFFGVEDLRNISEEVLKSAIERQPNSANDPELTPTLSNKKEVIALGRHNPLRLKPEEYAEAFGDWKGVPMYNAPVTASFVETYRDDRIYQPAYYLHDPRFKDCKFGAIITGDSMHSEIRHGDHVVCQEITDWRFVVYGDIYYIVSTNGMETCKYLNADPEDKNNFLLVPRNNTISPSPIPKDMILRMYKVRGVVRGY